MAKTLIIGYGNPGRLDDGLGPRCLQLLERLNLNPKDFTLDIDYQLALETALDISQHQQVIFIDASKDITEPYVFYPVKDIDNPPFSTHSVSPEALIALAKSLYQTSPKAMILAIKGYDFDAFGEYLSKDAQANLDAAFEFIKNYLLENSAHSHA